MKTILMRDRQGKNLCLVCDELDFAAKPTASPAVKKATAVPAVTLAPPQKAAEASAAMEIGSPSLPQQQQPAPGTSVFFFGGGFLTALCIWLRDRSTLA